MQLAFAHSADTTGIEYKEGLVSWWTQWTFDPALILFGLLFLFYMLGARAYRNTNKVHIQRVHLTLMSFALLFLILSLCSPIDYWANNSFAIHMVQHLLLLMVAAPLSLLALPIYPTLRGSRVILGSIMGKIAGWRPYRTLLRLLVSPPTNLIVFIIITWGWHSPILYNLALRVNFWHYAEHASFFLAAIIFWWPIINPTPFAKKYKDSTKIWLLVFATFQNSVLAALIVFNNGILYTEQYHYPQLIATGLAPLDDQKLGGLIMWIPGGMMYIIAFAALFAVMYSRENQARPTEATFVTPEIKP